MASNVRKRLKPNKERQLKKLTYQLKFLREELLDRNEFLDLYRLELREAVATYLRDIGHVATNDSLSKPIDDNSTQSVGSPDVFNNASIDDCEDEAGDEPPPSKEMKSLYRKIVLLTHPDKVDQMSSLTDEERLDRLETYKQACHAFDLRRYDDLVELAVYLEIDIDIPIHVKIKRMKDQVEKVSVKLESISSMIEWVWGNNFGNDAVRAKILGTVCQEMGLVQQGESELLEFIRRYDSSEAVQDRRNVGTRPDSRAHSETPKRRQ